MAAAPGDSAAETVDRFHGLVMNGGLHHALEVIEDVADGPDLLNALRVLGLTNLLSLVDRAASMQEAEANAAYEGLVPTDAVLEENLRGCDQASPGAVLQRLEKGQLMASSPCDHLDRVLDRRSPIEVVGRP